MKTNLFNLKHWARIGPGGWKCHCCGIVPSYRKVHSRKLKLKMTRMLDKLEQE